MVDAAVPALLDADYLVALREQMLRFAVAKLQDAHSAEDVVQEALMGALLNAQQFAEQSDLRTWVFGILKHKIADAQRRQRRQPQASPLEEPGDDLEAWLERQPGSAPVLNPAKMAESAQFERVLSGCMGDLSPQQAQVFGLRELNDVDPQAISIERGIGLSYVHVLLHRAKAKLRHCLEHHWLGRPVKPKNIG
ncbi:MAG TPA: sigma-70 family RNA polymerase sigma factor [Cellvibrionaceae bacterium]|nr:sigma-70 family RNA polymerase sigma factor [Cellvibrionaceae bacterium]HMW70655.1 sigma-70 family RNA polymerase sigma factor [Cellvibrionaceae bacterium]HMY38770.1 sigma-70 family RNA polymerase sigma factor [Marinagarivorans sp.]HNG58179.1 sigma-70 family RNA polymerase sigma factor [Cellvibrionaceae bacterium]